MVVVDWLHLQPTGLDLERTAESVRGVTHLHTVLRALVRAVLGAYPWLDRDDVVPLFDASKRYAPGDRVAFLEIDKKGLRPDTWHCATVEGVDDGGNPVQGAFQRVMVEVAGKQQVYVAGVSGAQPPLFECPPSDSEDLNWLVEDVVERYSAPLRGVIRTAVEQKRLNLILGSERALRAEELPRLTAQERTAVDVFFADPAPRSVRYRTTFEVLANLRHAGFLADVDYATGLFCVEYHMRAWGCFDLGRGRWLPAEDRARLQLISAHPTPDGSPLPQTVEDRAQQQAQPPSAPPTPDGSYARPEEQAPMAGSGRPVDPDVPGADDPLPHASDGDEAEPDERPANPSTGDAAESGDPLPSPTADDEAEAGQKMNLVTLQAPALHVAEWVREPEPRTAAAPPPPRARRPPAAPPPPHTRRPPAAALGLGIVLVCAAGILLVLPRPSAMRVQPPAAVAATPVSEVEPTVDRAPLEAPTAAMITAAAAAAEPAGSGAVSTTVVAATQTPRPTAATAIPTAVPRIVGRVQTAVVLRTGPGSDNRIIATLAPDTELEVLERTVDGWLKVRAGAQAGYVWAAFVALRP